MNMKERMRAKFLAKQAEQSAQRQAAQPPRKRIRQRVADQETQRARYLDAGPLAWDDRDNPDY